MRDRAESRRRGRGSAPAGRWALLLLVLGGCATYSKSFAPVERCLVDRGPEQALAALDAQPHPARDQLLYLLNRALLLRELGDYPASTAQFEQAKVVIERLRALSLREQAASLLLNDTRRSYAGEPHEQVLVHLFEALNYLEAGQLDEARVEALQVDLRLRAFAEEEPESPFRSDPLARYLTGLIYEERGEWSDALIAYRKAYEAYRDHARHYRLALPQDLQGDLLRLAERMQLSGELDAFRQEFGRDPGVSPLGADRGELVVLFHNGLAPVKREQQLVQLDPTSGLLVAIALPRYERRPRRAVAARVAAGGGAATTERVADIGALALESHEARLPGIKARAFARAAAKYAAARVAQEKNGAAGLLLNLAGTLTERADTRSWLTLPGEIQMARLSLPPGSYPVTVEVLGQGDRVLCREELPGVRIRAGRRTYVSRYWREL